MVTIREATRSDLDHLVILWLELSAEGHAADARYALGADAETTARGFIESEWIDDVDQIVLVATSAEHDGDTDDEGSTIVGFVTCRTAPTSRVLDAPVTYAIGDAYVRPGARRSGLATAMVNSAIAWAKQQGGASIEVGTLAMDHRAVAFWAALDFGDWRVTLRRDLS